MAERSRSRCSGTAMPMLLGIVGVVLLVALGGVVLSGHGRYLAQLLGVKPHLVKITWTPSKSPDVKGYYIYRAITPGGQMTKLNQLPVPLPEYADTDVEAGHTYYYGVTAVNTKNLESARTATISVTVPDP